MIKPFFLPTHKKLFFLTFFPDESYSTSLNLFLEKKILICVETPQNNFSDPQTKNLNKTRREHF